MTMPVLASRWRSVPRTAPFVVVTLTVFAVLLVFRPSTSDAATWTDLRGEHTIQADLVGIWGEYAILRRADGTRISIKLLDLRSDSRIQAEKLNEALNKHRQERVKELKTVAAEADAAAPKDIKPPAAASAYKAPQPDMDPDAFLQLLNDQARAGHHFVVYYDGLPPSYRKDVDELFSIATSKIDPSNWQALAKSLHDFGDLMVSHQNWIFSHPRMAAMETSSMKLHDSLLAFAGVLQTGFAADQSSLEKIRAMKLRDFLAAQDQALAPYLAQLAEQSEAMSQIVVDATTGETSTLSITVGAQPQKFAVTKVEGFWVPSAWAKTWADDMTKAKADLNAKSNGEILSGGLATILVNSLGTITAPLKEAKDATQFHLAMETMFQNAQPVMDAFASVDTSRFRLGGAAAGGYGAEDGYGDMGYDDVGYDGGSGYDGSSGGSSYGSGGGSSYGSGGPPTNAMEASRRTAEAASQSGTQGSGN